MNSSVGIYFGPKVIYLVEIKGKKLATQLTIPRPASENHSLDAESVPEDVKLVATMKDVFRKNKIEAQEVNMCLSGNDLIIRTFDIPVLPRNELAAAVNFEAKKYIPFRIDEMIASHQVIYDKASRKNMVLFIGIKKNTLQQYLSLFSHLNLRIASIEYSAFSSLRLMKLAGINEQGVIAMVNFDPKQEDEINFVVTENGFPLFSRDITLFTPTDEKTESEPNTAIDKLKTEIRISLDYYDRKFSSRNIKNVYFLTSQEYYPAFESFLKELGLVAQCIDTSKYTSPPLGGNIGLLKAYTASLASTIKSRYTVDLLVAKAALDARAAEPKQFEVNQLLADIRVEPAVLLVGALLLCSVFGWGIYRINPLQKDISDIISMRPQVATVNPSASLEQITDVKTQTTAKINEIRSALTDRLYLTDVFNAIPTELPNGVWLAEISFTKKAKTELTINGMAYLKDPQKELESINLFLSQLKKDAVFAKYFRDFSIVSVNQMALGKVNISKFTIACKK